MIRPSWSVFGAAGCIRTRRHLIFRQLGHSTTQSNEMERAHGLE